MVSFPKPLIRAGEGILPSLRSRFRYLNPCNRGGVSQSNETHPGRRKVTGGCGCSKQHPAWEPRQQLSSSATTGAGWGFVVLPARRLSFPGENHVGTFPVPAVPEHPGHRQAVPSSQLPTRTLLEAALVYAGIGLPVLPLHEINADGRCSCRQPGCTGKHRGKHPRLCGWQKQASTDGNRIRAWWSRWPAANIGIATGHDRIVLDVDGIEGRQTLVELERRHGPLPPTARARTGSGGLHFFFNTSLPVQTQIRFLPGLDVLAEVGFVVAPPSTHYSGNAYAWLRHPAEGIAICPDWLLSILLERKRPPSGKPSHDDRPGGSQESPPCLHHFNPSERDLPTNGWKPSPGEMPTL